MNLTYYDATSETDVYYVLTQSLTDSVFKSFYCSCCKSCSSSSSACIFPIPNPILLNQEWIVLTYHLSDNSFLSHEAFTHLLTLGKERMFSDYPKGVTLFHEGALQPYSHPNVYLTSDTSFHFYPIPYNDIDKLYRVYASLATYAQLTKHTVVWQCRWTSPFPQIEFRLVQLNKANPSTIFYSLGLQVENGKKDSGVYLNGLVDIPEEAYTTQVIFPDSLDILHWNKEQCKQQQRVLIKKLKSLNHLSSANIYCLGLYSIKLLQGGYNPETLKQDVLSLKWPSLIRSKGQKRKDPNVQR